MMNMNIDMPEQLIEREAGKKRDQKIIKHNSEMQDVLSSSIPHTVSIRSTLPTLTPPPDSLEKTLRPDKLIVPQLYTNATSSKVQLCYEKLDKFENEAKSYIIRCYERCVTNTEKDRVYIVLREKLIKSIRDSSSLITNRDNEPFPVAEKSLNDRGTSRYKTPSQRKKNLFIKLRNASRSHSSLRAIEWNLQRQRQINTTDTDGSIPRLEIDDKLVSPPTYKRIKKSHKKQNTKNQIKRIVKCHEKFRSISGEVPVNSELLKKRAERFVSNVKRIKDHHISEEGSKKDKCSKNVDSKHFHVVGTCQEIEKPYLRLTGAPEASEFRSLEVLRQSFRRVKACWLKDRDYNITCEQLKSIRQDLTVQGIRDNLTVNVYETHARIALEKGDHTEFNQCLSQLETLHKELPNNNRGEFIGYRILYCIFTNDTLDLTSVLMSLTQCDRSETSVQHALSVCSSWTLKNHRVLFHLYRKAPYMSSYLMDWFLPRERKLAVQAVMKAYRQSVPIAFLTKLLAFESESLCVEFLSKFGLIWSGLIW